MNAELSALLHEVFASSVVLAVRWTPIVVAAWLASRWLPSPVDRRRLWAFALLALPLMPAVGSLAPAWSMPAWRMSAGSEAAESTAAAPSQTSSPLAAARADGAPPPPADGGATPWAAIAWLLGVGLITARGLLGRVRTAVLVRSSIEAPAELRRRAAEAARAVGVRRARVRLGDVPVPLLCGALRPVVVLPLAAASWPATRVAASLLHELAHQRHRDPWLDLLARAVGGLFFFHPGVLLARRRLATEMEHAADRAAVERGGLGPADYGRALVEVAERSRAARWRPAVGLAMARRRSGGLEERIRALLASSGARTPRRRRLALGGAMALLLVAVAGVTSALASRAEDWLAGGDGHWQLRCGDSAECADIQAEADRLLFAAGHDGVVLVQSVDSGELLAYAARGPSPVPLVPPASLAKLALATSWWEAGLGDRPIECTASWTSPDGIEVRAVKDRGVIDSPHEMLVHSCSTAAGRMVEDLATAKGRLALEAELARLGFAPGATVAGVPSWLPAPRFETRRGTGATAELRRRDLTTALGRVATTPFHVAALVQAIGRDGEGLAMVRPGGGATSPERVMSSPTAERLRRAMAAVTREGTARAAAAGLAEVSWGLIGKTGTWARDEGTYDGRFAGLIVDAEGRARYVVVVFLDGGGLGGGAAADAAVDMTRFVAGRR